MFFKKVAVHRLRERASERLQRVSRDEVFQWAEVAMAGAWKCLEDAHKTTDADELAVHLEELERGLQQVLGAVDNLRSRGI
ncbi:hypothetical protein AB0K16_21920 [Nonomuraea jabiensis]|uniref:hypothetical protein n=1 Tax=Nonomuraea jabiensis TaxID=882448 RepID=UPI0034458598